MTAQMTDKEIIEGLKLEHDILSRTSHSDPRGPSEQQKERMELYRAAISRLQSIQWRPIEEAPEEWKDGRQVDLIISGELEMGCCFLKSPNGWNCGPHDEWYSDGDKYITHIRLPEDLSALIKKRSR